MAGEAAQFATHTVSNAIQGHGWSSFGRGFDDMGGLTFNLMNVSTIARLLGVDGDLANEMSLGLFELQITGSGVSSRFGTAGVDISAMMFDAAAWGLAALRERQATETAQQMAEGQLPENLVDELLFDENLLREILEEFLDLENNIEIWEERGLDWLFSNFYNDYQDSHEDSSYTPLFDSPSREYVEERNRQIEERNRRIEALENVIAKGESLPAFFGGQAMIARMMLDNMGDTTPERLLDFISIARSGCVLMVVKYGLQAIMRTEEPIDTVAFHNRIHANRNLFTPVNALGYWNMSRIMTEFSDGQFRVEHGEPLHNPRDTLEIAAQIRERETSGNVYIAHVRIRDPERPGAINETHSVMVRNFNFRVENGQTVGINSFDVINPLRPSNHFNSRLNFEMDSVIRIDFFRVTRN